MDHDQIANRNTILPSNSYMNFFSEQNKLAKQNQMYSSITKNNELNQSAQLFPCHLSSQSTYSASFMMTPTSSDANSDIIILPPLTTETTTHLISSSISNSSSSSYPSMNNLISNSSHFDPKHIEQHSYTNITSFTHNLNHIKDHGDNNVQVQNSSNITINNSSTSNNNHYLISEYPINTTLNDSTRNYNTYFKSSVV